VAYYAVCFFNELVEIRDAEFVGLDWSRIVLGQNLVEYGGDVHCGGGESKLS